LREVVEVLDTLIQIKEDLEVVLVDLMLVVEKVQHMIQMQLELMELLELAVAEVDHLQVEVQIIIGLECREDLVL
jgi:hypothetical protein